MDPGIKKGKGLKTTRNSAFVVQRERIKDTRNNLLVENSKSFNQRFSTGPIVPISIFDLIDAASALAIQNFRGVFMIDQLSKQPKRVETGLINLDNSSGSGTHLVAYVIDPRGIVYFDSYGLAPPSEFMRYIMENPKDFQRRIIQFRFFIRRCQHNN